MGKRQKTRNFGGKRVQENDQITEEENSKCRILLICWEVFKVEEIIVITKRI